MTAQMKPPFSHILQWWITTCFSYT